MMLAALATVSIGRATAMNAISTADPAIAPCSPSSFDSTLPVVGDIAETALAVFGDCKLCQLSHDHI